MNEEIFTHITAAGGEQQKCILKEKTNNGNGKLVYRFHNQNCGDEYTLTRDGQGWQSLNDCRLPEYNLKELTDFADGLNE